MPRCQLGSWIFSREPKPWRSSRHSKTEDVLTTLTLISAKDSNSETALNKFGFTHSCWSSGGWHAYQWKTPLQESSQSHRCITWCTTCIWLFHTCEILRYPRYPGPSRSSPFPPWTKTKDHNSTIRADQSCKAIQTYPRQSAPKWWSRRQIGLNGAEMQKRGIKYKQADPKSLHIWKFWGMKIRDSKYAVL